MQRGASITDLPTDVFTLIADRLLPISKDGTLADPLSFACLRLSSRGVRTLCDAAVCRLNPCNCNGDEMRHLLRRFCGRAPSFDTSIVAYQHAFGACKTKMSCVAATACAAQSTMLQESFLDCDAAHCIMFDCRCESAGAAAIVQPGRPAPSVAAAACHPAQPGADVRV